jgi:hypothetical protein
LSGFNLRCKSAEEASKKDPGRSDVGSLRIAVSAKGQAQGVGRDLSGFESRSSIKNASPGSSQMGCTRTPFIRQRASIGILRLLLPILLLLLACIPSQGVLVRVGACDTPGIIKKAQTLDSKTLKTEEYNYASFVF